VEKFALRYLESQMADIAAEQLRQAEVSIYIYFSAAVKYLEIKKV